VPDLFRSLRRLIDEGPRSSYRTGRFLTLGSASLDLSRQSGERLAGRIAYVDMAPFDILETTAANSDDAAAPLWARGGFPERYLAGDDRKSLRWRRGFIRSYLEREVPLFGPQAPAETLERL